MKPAILQPVPRNRLRTIRRVLQRERPLHYSVKSISRRIGVSEAQIRRWERCENGPRVDLAITIAKDLGVTVEQLWLDI